MTGLVRLLARAAALALCCAAVGAQPVPTSAVPELSAASGLPESEITALLADCAANQQAQYFCAWRDRLEAEHKLDAALSQRSQASPECGKRLAGEAPRWKSQVQRHCQATAAKAWGGGSMQRTAELACAANAFEHAAAELPSEKSCRLPAARR
jgi:hypothetical protein